MSIENIPGNTWLGISEQIKKFFEDKVANDIFLQLQDTEDDPVYRKPCVVLQNFPHKNFSPPDGFSDEYQAPSILIQTHSLKAKNETITLSVRAIFSVYSSVNYESENLKNYVPDNKSYADLMIIMQKAIESIRTYQSFGNAILATDSEITADIYEFELPTWPYGYGFIEFDVQYYSPLIACIEPTENNIDLNL